MYEKIKKEILKTCSLDIENINCVDKDEFALARRHGLGASDTAVYMELQKFKTPGELLEEKLLKEVTDKERSIGELPNVRKGSDLEPLILQKAATQLGVDLYKPQDMYRHKEHTQLTVNFDGIYLNEDNNLVPVECKWASQWALKWWNWETDAAVVLQNNLISYNDIKNTQERVKAIAKDIGIPEYYYPQVQHQIYTCGENCQYGYLAGMNDKEWKVKLFYIPRDDKFINQMLLAAFKFWQKVEQRR